MCDYRERQEELEGAVEDVEECLHHIVDQEARVTGIDVFGQAGCSGLSHRR